MTTDSKTPIAGRTDLLKDVVAKKITKPAFLSFYHYRDKIKSAVKNTLKNISSRLVFHLKPLPPFVIKYCVSILVLVTFLLLSMNLFDNPKLTFTSEIANSFTNKANLLAALEAYRYLLLIIVLFIALVFYLGFSLHRWWESRLKKLLDYTKNLDKDKKPKDLKNLNEPHLNALAKELKSLPDRLDSRDFVAQYIHTLTQQVQEPLDAINNAMAVLNTPQQPLEVITDAKKNITGAVGMLKKTVARLDDLTSMEYLKAAPKKEFIDISNQLDSLILAKKVLLTKKTIGVTITIRHDLNLYGDPELFAKAMDNLMDNAIDISGENKHINIEAQREGKDVRITFTDQGKGIEEETLKKVYDKFYTAAPGKKAGIGLNFVQVVAKLHKGRVEISNSEQESEGVKASLYLPETPKKPALKLTFSQKIKQKFKQLFTVK